MVEGKVRPNHRGHYIVEKVQTGGESRRPEIRFFTPVAQDIELAKSEIKANKSKETAREPIDNKRPKVVTYKANKKRRYVDDVFAK